MAAPTLKSEVLIPLYIYPNPGSWDPLFEAVESHPTLQFIVIINPNSGPGSKPWWPNADYVRDIPRLNARPNVRIVGYVSTAYCKRSIDNVLGDVETYARWNGNESFPALGLNGIFFDETPNVFSEEARDYLDTITQKVKNTEGILGDRIVIHNPGTSVDQDLASSGLDIATVAELAYSDYCKIEYQDWISRSTLERHRTSYMIHGVPMENVEEFVLSKVRPHAYYIFVTDRCTDVYHDFGKSWESFIAAMTNISAPVTTEL